MENIEFVEATAAEVAEAIQPKRKSKKAKPESVAEPVAEQVVEPPELQCGHVVYRNDYTHVIGFECNGIGYQIPAGDFDYHIGDPIDFMIVDGKVIIGVV